MNKMKQSLVLLLLWPLSDSGDRLQEKVPRWGPPWFVVSMVCQKKPQNSSYGDAQMQDTQRKT